MIKPLKRGSLSLRPRITDDFAELFGWWKQEPLRPFKRLPSEALSDVHRAWALLKWLSASAESIERCRPSAQSIRGRHVAMEQYTQCRAELLKFIDENNCAPIMVRLAWHDSGTEYAVL